MLRISRLTEYACMILVTLDACDKALSAGLAAQHTGVEKPTVSKVLKLLRQSGLLVSKRGVSGGYQLNIPINNISLYEVVRAMEGNIALTDCSQDHSKCTHQFNCLVSTGLKKVNDIIGNTLKQVFISELREENYSIPVVIKS